MHKKTIKRNVSTTSKIKAPQHLLRIQDDELDEDALQGITLPDLQKKECSRKIGSPTSWDRTSGSTSLSWPEDMESVATEKLLKQWDDIDRVLYGETDQLSNSEIFEECVQWKTQIPHLRIVGKGLFHTNTCKSADDSTNTKIQTVFDHYERPKSSIEHYQEVKDTNESSKNQKYKKLKEDVFNIILEYVNSQIFPIKDNDTDTLDSTLTDVLKITPAPICKTRTFTRSYKSTRLGDKMAYHDQCGNNSLHIDNAERSEQDLTDKLKLETMKINKHSLQRGKEHSISASKVKGLQAVENNIGCEKDRLYTPQQSRNKLGTVFNEKIVVSPVPFAVSTRESFSTLKTIPIRFMSQTLQIPTQGSARNSVSHIKPLWKSNNIKMPDSHSAWHAPVSPAVWPKNLRLAPIDTSRFPSSKNRSSAASPAVLQRCVKPLSPISRSIMPSTTKVMRDKHNDILEIQGKHVTAGQVQKSAQFTTNWDYSPRSTASRKKKLQVKNEK